MQLAECAQLHALQAVSAQRGMLPVQLQQPDLAHPGGRVRAAEQQQLEVVALALGVLHDQAGDGQGDAPRGDEAVAPQRLQIHNGRCRSLQARKVHCRCAPVWSHVASSQAQAGERAAAVVQEARESWPSDQVANLDLQLLPVCSPRPQQRGAQRCCWRGGVVVPHTAQPHMCGLLCRHVCSCRPVFGD